MKRACLLVAATARSWIRTLHTCRECGGPVRPTYDICPACGVAYPVKLPTATIVNVMLSVALLWVVLSQWT